MSAIAEAIWSIPEAIKAEALAYLPEDIMNIYAQFVVKTTKK